jgi:hypothetical protein
MRYLKKLLIGFALVSLLLLSACKQEPVTSTPGIDSDQTPATDITVEQGTLQPEQPAEELTEQDSVVVPEQVQSQLLLWASAGGDPNLTQSFEAQLQAYSTQNGLSFERRENLSPSQLGTQTQLVVALVSWQELQSMAQENAQAQYLFIGQPEGELMPNVHVLSQTQVLPEQQSFLAGLAAVLGTPEYRVGSITMSNTPAGQIARDGFRTGARYFCGLCRSRYTPLILYPIQQELEDPANWQGAVDYLLSQEVKTVFVQPEASSPELISALNARGVTIIAIEGQNGLEHAQNILGVFSSGAVADIAPIVERILANEPLGVIKIGLELTRVDETKLGAGKLILFERYKEDLLNGEIKALPHGQ